MKPSWRLIDSGSSDAFLNMALDEAIAVSVREGFSPPTLRLYGWEPPSLSIGCFQSTRDIDLDYASSSGIPIVRRPTGGRGILHKEELTYCFSSRNEGAFSKGLMESYRVLSRVFFNAFSALGLDVDAEERKRMREVSPLCFRVASFGEITAKGKKIIGSAQRRWSDGFLQQGAIPMKTDAAMNLRLFGDDGSGSMAGLAELMPSLTAGILKEKIIGSFEDAFGIGFSTGKPTPREEELASALLRDKYLRREWNLRR